jgi:hypothetical protein
MRIFVDGQTRKKSKKLLLWSYVPALAFIYAKTDRHEANAGRIPRWKASLDTFQKHLSVDARGLYFRSYRISNLQENKNPWAEAHSELHDFLNLPPRGSL